MEEKITVIKSDTLGYILTMLFVLIIAIMLILSIVLPDKTVSEKENRALASFPSFSVSALFSGEFFKEFETYYSDTFPFRNGFLAINEKIDKVLAQFSVGKGDNDVVVIDSNKERDMGGTSIEEAEGAKK